MGPTIICDKSALECLNPDEAMWLDNFFLFNIVPSFYVEILADLEKQIKDGRTPEKVVGNLAYKTPDASSSPNAHHKYLLEGELFGLGVLDLKTGRPHISGGVKKELGGRAGVFVQSPPEQEAFSRWQKGEFLDLERLFAKSWRQALTNINFENIYKYYQKFFPLGRPKNLTEVKKFVDFFLESSDQEQVLVFGLTLIGLTPQAQAEVVQRWRNSGKPRIIEFAPYFFHILSIDLFFNLGIASDLIGRGRASHKIDLSYLYYLPFCMIFASNDKLHEAIAPFFLREDQTFILGDDLKADLARLDAYYERLPQEEKNRGVMSFAFYPPDSTDFLTSRLWDKYMRPDWRERQIHPKPQPESDHGKEIMERIKKLRDAEPLPRTTNESSSDNVDEMVIERKVLAKKGKWTRFPPEVLNRRKNDSGEWEDIPAQEKF